MPRTSPRFAKPPTLPCGHPIPSEVICLSTEPSTCQTCYLAQESRICEQHAVQQQQQLAQYKRENKPQDTIDWMRQMSENDLQTQLTYFRARRMAQTDESVRARLEPLLRRESIFSQEF
jgi:hypothetical protein